MAKLKAPFPYYGGKSRWAPLIWERLGNPTVYSEPFAGSIAVLLARPGGAGPREIVCDLDGMICNVWRAVTADPEAVAHYANWPTIHQDLTARHAWLRRWKIENAPTLSQDPDFYDAKAAGWWIWGISLWIGGDWCKVDFQGANLRPHIEASTGGRGVSAQRRTGIPQLAAFLGGRGVSAQRRALDKRPFVHDSPGGRGASAQRAQIPSIPSELGGRGVSAQREKIPFVAYQGGGQGVSYQRNDIDKRPPVYDHPGGPGVSPQRVDGHLGQLFSWFAALQDRLAAVVVLNRDWSSAVTPTLLMHTPSSPKPPVGVFLDPPYRTDTGRKSVLYDSDYLGASDDAAEAAYAWAVEHGERYRIAYACHEGDFEIPPGWDASSRPFGGVRTVSRRKTQQDMVMFSPACGGGPVQGKLV